MCGAATFMIHLAIASNWWIRASRASIRPVRSRPCRGLAAFDGHENCSSIEEGQAPIEEPGIGAAQRGEDEVPRVGEKLAGVANAETHGVAPGASTNGGGQVHRRRRTVEATG